MARISGTKNGQTTMAERREMAANAETVRELIDALGGPMKVAGALKITHPSVCAWIREDRIPHRKLPKLANKFQLRRRPLKLFVRTDSVEIE
jgi:hypothetical protein